MALNLQPYQIRKIDDETFVFNTKKNIEYVCSFLSYAEYFSKWPNIAPYFFSFNLELRNKNANLPLGTDKRIADTAITIVGNFLNSKTNAVVYVCDNSDGREATRSRKFMSWLIITYILQAELYKCLMTLKPVVCISTLVCSYTGKISFFPK